MIATGRGAREPPRCGRTGGLIRPDASLRDRMDAAREERDVLGTNAQATGAATRSASASAASCESTVSVTR